VWAVNPRTPTLRGTATNACTTTRHGEASLVRGEAARCAQVRRVACVQAFLMPTQPALRRRSPPRCVVGKVCSCTRFHKMPSSTVECAQLSAPAALRYANSHSLYMVVHGGPAWQAWDAAKARATSALVRQSRPPQIMSESRRLTGRVFGARMVLVSPQVLWRSRCQSRDAALLQSPPMPDVALR